MLTKMYTWSGSTLELVDDEVTENAAELKQSCENEEAVEIVVNHNIDKDCAQKEETNTIVIANKSYSELEVNKAFCENINQTRDTDSTDHDKKIHVKTATVCGTPTISKFNKYNNE